MGLNVRGNLDLRAPGGSLIFPEIIFVCLAPELVTISGCSFLACFLELAFFLSIPSDFISLFLS